MTMTGVKVASSTRATAFDDVRYAIEEAGRLVAAGNMTAYRGLPADVGLVTRP